jgi:hypothetical protein
MDGPAAESAAVATAARPEGSGGREHVDGLDLDWLGERTSQFNGLPVDGDAGDVLGAVFIGAAEENGLVDCLARLRRGVDQQRFVDGFRWRGEDALLRAGLGAGCGFELGREQFAVELDDGGLRTGCVGRPAKHDTLFVELSGKSGNRSGRLTG